MPFFFLEFNAGILNIPGIKYVQNGYINDNPKLKTVSFIKWICVWMYIPQKQET